MRRTGCIGLVVGGHAWRRRRGMVGDMAKGMGLLGHVQHGGVLLLLCIMGRVRLWRVLGMLGLLGSSHHVGGMGIVCRRWHLPGCCVGQVGMLLVL